MSKVEYKMNIEVNGKKSVMVMGENKLTAYLNSKKKSSEQELGM